MWSALMEVEESEMIRILSVKKKKIYALFALKKQHLNNIR
jgi:hypothetical protein